MTAPLRRRRSFAVTVIQGHSVLPGLLDADSVVLDLGGSLGHFSRTLAAMTGCRCHVVEAAPENAARIAADERITPYHFAAGGTDGPVTLTLADDGFHWGSVAPAPDTPRVGAVTVPGITLATLAARLGLARIDLMKVDIEGAEIALFDAAPDDLLRSIAQITVEFHDFADPARTPDVRRVLSRLESLGFAVLVMSRRFHGDVLLVNRALAGITPARLLWLGTAVKYGRGMARIAARWSGRRVLRP